jgi:hypothetical protein
MGKMKMTGLVFLGLIGLLLLSVVGIVCNYAGEAVQVAQEEFGPRELLRKYEWFKDAAAQLERKRSDIDVYQVRLDVLNEYARNEWDRIDKENYAQWQTEVAGVTSSFNMLAAEYNSQMAKFNWQFCNAGQMPKGVPSDATPLPREFAEYRNK